MVHTANNNKADYIFLPKTASLSFLLRLQADVPIPTLCLGILGKLLLSLTALCRECHTLMSITLLLSQDIRDVLFRTASLLCRAPM